jgi:hypothetical protein
MRGVPKNSRPGSIADFPLDNIRSAAYKEGMAKHKNAAAAALGRKGGKATASRRTKQERSEAARKAINARWAKYREEKNK